MTLFAEPARRTYEDAETLLEIGRLATPDHLYGLACECALKAILAGLGVIATTCPPRQFKVHMPQLWNEYLAVLSGRVASGLAVATTNPFAAWKVEDRYRDDADFTTQRVRGHRFGAQQAMALLQRAQTEGIVE